ncbi:phosphocholine-specific phospholipase C [Caldimonas brevitalea]|uniref:phospholipase C n=1 Tax=Caldimonas brevitalea TaxID=413882 RepID=A0A0G3BH87_9BURK|nr:phospholipase C, phosphocholine-specific [Caldimonas brevitalea]AKJ27328.1 phospholipase C [Caldimonas brevitalea]
MTALERRALLKLIGTASLTGAVPPSIARALAVPAHRRTGTLKDVEHIIILTQENRSFDHYFGTLRGVRGYADPRAVKLRSGKPVWYQPHGSGELLPFRPPVEDVGRTFLQDPPHGWNDTHAAWNGGQHDGWVPHKGTVAMTYHTRQDLPYHFALADAFTVCDAYHCSLMGPTDPNRYHLWSGWVGNDGSGGGPVIDNAELGYHWSTYPERLQRAGITWKVYQDIGVGLNAAGSWGWTRDPYIGNYGDNSLLYFHQYQNAQPGTPLADRAKTGTRVETLGRDPARLLDDFREDVRHGRLPQVSWIAAPEAYTEHPNFPADYGAWYLSQVIDILASHPEVFSKTVLFIHYDEEGGFFDHVVPPTPPLSSAHGASTVDTTHEIYPGDPVHAKAPYGLGMRVPMLVVSPWSKGGWVNSEVFDHTSLIRFLEARFADQHPGLVETNITPWRRAVVGDLTSAFDFSARETHPVRLPDTQNLRPSDLERHDDYALTAPRQQRLPEQERGVRPARALPYVPHVHGWLHPLQGTFHLEFGNTGRAAIVYQVRSGKGAHPPRTYTVEPQRLLSGSWDVASAGASEYDLAVYGPNGFLRAFRGGVGGQHNARLGVRCLYDAGRCALALMVTNLSSRALTVQMADQYTGQRVEERLRPGEPTVKRWGLQRQHGWYDLVLTVEGDAQFRQQLAGHLETGTHSITDPAMGRVRLHD